MAENKKSFLLYCDLIHTVSKLDDAQAGNLFKHILNYVNDLNPVAENIITEIAFEPVKQALKRDLQKYISICERNKNNGQSGGRPAKEPKKPTGLFGNPNKPKKADSDSDSDKDKDINKKRRNAIAFIPPNINEVIEYFTSNGYIGGDRFYNSYSVNDWIDTKGNKIKNWKQKANMVWFKPENKITVQSTFQPMYR